MYRIHHKKYFTTWECKLAVWASSVVNGEEEIHLKGDPILF